MPLSHNAIRVLAFIEQFWFEAETNPTTEEIAKHVNLAEPVVKNLYKNEEFLKALEERGIPTAQNQGLTFDQLTAANAVLNAADKRSFRKKLSDAGVSPKQWQGWQRNPAFRHYMLQHSEKLLTDGIAEAHVALVDNVQQGDVASIKLLYEMTGRFKSGSNEVNVPLLVQQILSIIERNVTDPETLLRISQDFQTLMAGARVSQGNDSPAPSFTTLVAAPVARKELPL